jgi:TusA-related sulfurtransferase
MSCRHDSPDRGRTWISPDGLHFDARSLECPEPMLEVLGMIDRGEAGDTLIVHFDQEPIFLYPELADRGWTHEVQTEGCGDGGCEHGVQLRLTRMTA